MSANALDIEALFDIEGVIEKGMQISAAALTGQHTSFLFAENDLWIRARLGLFCVMRLKSFAKAVCQLHTTHKI